jgi:hypothetical protein
LPPGPSQGLAYAPVWLKAFRGLQGDVLVKKERGLGMHCKFGEVKYAQESSLYDRVTVKAVLD